MQYVYCMGAFMQYEIGQILYLFIQDDMKIIPVQVVEQVTKKSLNTDTSISYTVRLPNKSRTQTNLADLDATAFTSLDAIRSFMIENATMNIQKMVMRADEVSKSIFTKDDYEQHNEGMVD